MASGAKVNPQCISVMSAMATDKSRLYLVMKLSEDNTEIILDKEVAKPEGFCKNSTSDTIHSLLLDELNTRRNSCCYIIYDFQYLNKKTNAIASRLLLISWAPDSCKIKEKMVHASSKGLFKGSFSNSVLEVQATDMDEVSFESLLDKVERF